LVIEKLSSKDFFGRDLILIQVKKIEDFDLKKLTQLSKYFILLIVNNSEVIVNHYGKKAKELINSGLAYLCACGIDCEKIHDIFDEENVRMEIDQEIETDEDNVIMTTWHQDESIKESLFYFLYNTATTEKYYSDCKTSLVLTIGDSNESENIRKYLENQKLLENN
jgi:hypothetical protein